ncbi:HPr kinase/phosphorylase [uncultured Roseobacter sp.]|uniref:HPr kinase/phosphorylase n=1 Tax=uncultured Roseobacter sp. TaxID=114847 RepID=UPI00262FE8DA|nr:aldolase [uncultured Roseobacter sp.]
MEGGDTETSESPGATTIHASCVAYRGRGVLILGESGRGKSALALQLMAYGADLIADDRTEVTLTGGVVHAAPPRALAGLIEARGVGLLTAEHAGSAEVVLTVDLDTPETARLPAVHTAHVVGVPIPCLHKVDSAYFPAAILQYLKAGRRDPG